MKALRIGTRGSPLALAQAGQVAQQIQAVSGLPTELVVVRTEGDDVRVPLNAPNRPGAFVARLRDELLAGDVDVAVHSYKDVPTAKIAELQVVAVPQRAEPRDALVSQNRLLLADLPAGARVGTSSPRRRAALLRQRPDLEIVPVRGNVDTRIKLVHDGSVTAVVLAAAGLVRLNRDDEIAQLIPAEIMIPAPAQGALAVEMRADDPLTDAVTLIRSVPAQLLATAEREVLVGINASCTTAIGAFAQWIPESPNDMRLTAELTIAGKYARVTEVLPVAATEDAQALGKLVAERLLTQ